MLFRTEQYGKSWLIFFLLVNVLFFLDLSLSFLLKWFYAFVTNLVPKLPSVVSSFKMFTYIAYYQFHLFLEKPDILWYSLVVFYTWYITIMWNLLHHCLVFSSVQFSHSVVSDSLWPHGLQHARPPCPSQTPGVYSNSCPSSHWCHPIISSSVIPFSSHLQSFPASGSFQMSQFFCIRWPKYWSFSFNISPSNEHLGLICFRMDWLDLLAVQGTLKNLLQHHSSKASILCRWAFFIVQLSHPCMVTRKT